MKGTLSQGKLNEFVRRFFASIKVYDLSLSAKFAFKISKRRYDHGRDEQKYNR